MLIPAYVAYSFPTYSTSPKPMLIPKYQDDTGRLWQVLQYRITPHSQVTNVHALSIHNDTYTLVRWEERYDLTSKLLVWDVQHVTLDSPVQYTSTQTIPQNPPQYMLYLIRGHYTNSLSRTE